MPLISEKSQKNKLKQFNINIKTKYIVKNNILERNTNDSYNDDIKNGIRCLKEYYLDNNLLHKENKFDSRIEYTYISKKYEIEEYECPNCGMKSKIEDFIDGCPYCRTYYNIDYIEKDLGSKYHYDRVLRNTSYRIITAFIDVIISLILSYIFIKTTSRTFNSYDVSKVFIYGSVLSLVLFYFFYILDAYIVLKPIKIYKDAQNKKQIEFWDRTKIDKKIFYNNLNYELRNLYYQNPDIVDYDIIDFDEFNEYKKDNNLFVKVKIYLRVVYFKNNKFISKYINDTHILKNINEDKIHLKEGTNFIKCNNCGASIDATKGYCEHCNSKINYFQEWVLVKDNHIS